MYKFVKFLEHDPQDIELLHRYTDWWYQTCWRISVLVPSTNRCLLSSSSNRYSLKWFMFENLVIEAINANSMAKNTSTVGILISGIISPFYQSCFTLIALSSISRHNFRLKFCKLKACLKFIHVKSGTSWSIARNPRLSNQRRPDILIW